MAKSERPPAILIIQTALDTTWRMFVPILSSVWLGITLDHWQGSAPVATIICLVFGTFLSGLLIYRQLNALKAENNKNNEDKLK